MTATEHPAIGLSKPSGFDAKWPIIGAAVLIVAWLALVPLVFLLWQSFMTPASPGMPAMFTLANYSNVYTGAETFRLLGNSLTFASGAAVLSLVLGTSLAWLNERTNTPFKSLVYALSVVPLVIPGILFVTAWIMLASPKIGVLNLLLQRAFDTDHVFFDVYTLPGMMWVDGIQHAPLAFLLMSAAFRSMDPSLEESALMSGASILQVARRVTLRLALPALAASFLILFVRSIESFENPALLGPRRSMKLCMPIPAMWDWLRHTPLRCSSSPRAASTGNRVSRAMAVATPLSAARATVRAGWTSAIGAMPPPASSFFMPRW